VTKESLAEEACRIEIDVLKKPMGKQDQFASSCGGLNFLRFNADESVFIDPVIMEDGLRVKLENHLMLFYVGNDRQASRILAEQKKKMRDREKIRKVQELVKLAERFKQTLQDGRIEQVGALLDEGWRKKKTLVASISNPELDAIYAQALEAGASGGKLLGAGGGGFFLFFCQPEGQDRLAGALGLKKLDFRFDREGTKVIFCET